MIDGGKIIGYGFHMVISEILTWKITATLHWIFNIDARCSHAGKPSLSAQAARRTAAHGITPSYPGYINTRCCC